MAISDGLRMRHMRDAAQAAMRQVAGRRQEDLDSDETMQLALARAIEIVCEAATKISVKTKQRYSEFPWRQMTGLRNRLVHAYADVSLRILWDVAIVELPAIMPKLEEMIRENEP